MKVLAIDSSGIVASAAIVEDERVLSEFTINDKKTHSQTLLPMISAMKDMTSMELNDLDAVAVAKGPGSFTGLRIGVSTAKGIALALDIPIIGVPTVDAIAYQFFDTDALICPMMDARRSQVYSGLYHIRGGELKIVKEQCAIAASDIVNIINEIGERVIFSGDGADVYKDLIKESITTEYIFAEPFVSKQRAAALGALAIKYAGEGKIETGEQFKPEYLRPSQAERERAVLLKTVEFGKMLSEDTKQVAELEKEVFSKPWSENELEKSMKLPDYCFITAKKSGRVIGYCGFYTTIDEANITNVAVSKDFRAKGIGHALMTELIKSARERGMSLVTLEVRLSNMPARNLYESLGFKLEGQRKNFYEEPVENACIYRLKIK